MMLWLSVMTIVAGMAAEGLGPGDHGRSIKVGELKRYYQVHVPPGYRHDQLTPLVIAFHGGGANADNMKIFSGLNQKADKENFIVVYPQGTGRLARMLTFNGGNCCGYAMTNAIDDVDFTGKLLDDLETVLNLDKKRVFATGMSNGAIMAYRIAAELSDRVAAIAPVSGPLGTDTVNPKRPVPVIHFHGTADENAPFGGGRGKGPSGTNFFSVEYTIQSWVKANGCKNKPDLTEIEDKAGDGTSVTIKTFSQGKNDSEVVLVEIKGGGHTWPGQEARLKSLGKSTRNISANDMMWDFFKKHPMK